MSVNGIFSIDILPVIDGVRFLIAPCLDLYDTGYSFDDLLTAIQLRDKQLWIINDGEAAGITSIQVLPQWKKLVVEYLGGNNMENWQDEWFSEMNLFATANDCKYIEVHGRKGWAKLAKSRGDKIDMITISRKLV